MKVRRYQILKGNTGRYGAFEGNRLVGIYSTKSSAKKAIAKDCDRLNNAYNKKFQFEINDED